MNNDNANLLTDNKSYNKVVESKQVYAFTMTYRNIQRATPMGQFWECVPYTCKLLSLATSYELVPEWRHASGDIHLHGIIRITNMIKWFKSTLPRLKSLGFLMIKPCTDKAGIDDKWRQYYYKEIDIARGILPPSVALPIITIPDKDKVIKNTSSNKD